MRRLAFLTVLGLSLSYGHTEEPTPASTRCRPLPGVARWALPSESPLECGYYVGGGVGPRHGQPPCSHEGTWGWDYQGILPRRIALWWSHGAREQGGLGAYRTVGVNLREKSSP